MNAHPIMPDPVLIRQHFEMLHERAAAAKVDGVLVLAGFGENPATGKKLQPRCTPFAIGDVDGMTAAALSLCQEPHRNVYTSWTVMRKDLPRGARGEKRDIRAVLALTVDQDADHGMRDIELPLEAPYTIASSSENRQPIYPLARALTGPEAHPIAEALAAAVGGDGGTKDIDHVWRVPGCLNWPNAEKLRRGRPPAPQLVTVASAWGGELVDPDALKAASEALRGANGTKTKPTVNGEGVRWECDTGIGGPVTVEDYAELLRGARTDGKKHYAVRDLAWDFATRGVPMALCEAFVKDVCPVWNDNTENLIKSGYEKAGMYRSVDEDIDFDAKPEEETTKAKGFQFVRVGEMEDREPEFLIEDLLETDSLAMLFGDPGGGKSFVGIDITACVASGANYHGLDVREGAALYIAGEGKNGLKRRFRAWEEHNGVLLDDAPLFLSTVGTAFLDAGAAAEVAKAVEAVAAIRKPALIVIDTVARNFGPGDENSTKDMSTFVAAIDRLREQWECTVLLIHHSGHGEKTRARGSIVLKGALDAEYRVSKSGDFVTLASTKMKDAPMPKPMVFKMEVVDLGVTKAGKLITSAAFDLMQSTRPAESKPLTPAAKLALAAWRTVADTDAARRDESGAFLGVHLADWRTEFYRVSSADTDAAKRQAFGRARKELVDAGALSVSDDVYQTQKPEERDT